MDSTHALKEICYIYHQRNLLARERDKTRHKYRYLLDIKRFMYYHNPSEDSDVKRARSLIARAQSNISKYRAHDDKINNEWIKVLKDTRLKLDSRLKTLTELAAKNPIPKKWLKISKSELNLLILEADAATTQSKIDIMKHTKKYANRLKKLGTHCLYSPKYVCGVVRGLTINCDTFITESDMKQKHDEYLADLAIEKMLTE